MRTRGRLRKKMAARLTWIGMRAEAEKRVTHVAGSSYGREELGFRGIDNGRKLLGWKERCNRFLQHRGKK